MSEQSQSIAAVVAARAVCDGQRVAYTFLAEGTGPGQSITWAELDVRARRIAAALRERGAAREPVVLALGSGLGFVESLLGCWYAGAIAVPVSLPRHQRVKHRLDRIIGDAGARFAIGTRETRQRLASGQEQAAVFEAMTWVDPIEVEAGPDSGERSPIAADDAAVLQYTSGSTGLPRGVLVTHENLMCNSALIAQACGHGPESVIAGWLPLFHDMGLVGLVIQAAYTGARCVLMPPERFLMRPWQWLQMISDYRACSSPAPNFAYDLCVDRISLEQKSTLDLSCWRTALNGSEPVRASTLDRFATAFAECGFAREAFFPCYGLAEATLFVTGPVQRRERVCRDVSGKPTAGGHVGCGQAIGDTAVAIVDSQSRRRVRAGDIGEIWVAGGSCARGYWKDAAGSAATFAAQIVGEESGPWLRTGDLGFVAEAELFITGRLRELIIIAGRNLFPVDIERTVESADAAVALSGSVAIAVEIDGGERLVVLAEARRELARGAGGDRLDAPAVCRRIRAAIAAEHEVAAHDVVLLRPGGVPRTTSGKVSRSAARAAYLNDTLERFEELCDVHRV